MNNGNQFQVTGQELGYEGVDRLVGQVEAVCVHERQRIELANESRLVAHKLELAMWADEEKRIGERLRLAPPPGNKRVRQLQAWFAGTVALVLTVASFFFSLLAFDPFRFGLKSYLYCVGIAVVSPFCVEKCLKEWDCRGLVKGAAMIACAAALASLVLLALIRGDLIGQQLKDAETQAAVIDDNSAASQSDNHFYEDVLPILRLVMALLAVAMELGAGLALHELKKLLSDSGEDAEQVARELMQVRLRMAALGSQTVECANEGAIFEQRFWRDFYRAMLTHAARKALGKFLALFLCLAALGASAVRADDPRLNLVVLIDLSASVASKGADGRTDFERNVAAVTELLARIPAGSRITILGITGNSFAEPAILLRAEIPGDVGYFGERLAAAHRQLVRVWQLRSAHVSPTARQTDIVGALLVASQFFSEDPRAAKKMLIVYSDMRQETRELNLSRSLGVPGATVRAAGTTNPLPELKGASVYALGVDAAGSTAVVWERLHQFWSEYFARTDARLERYSALREVPSI